MLRIMAVLAGALTLLPLHAGAHDYRVGSILIDHPWALATLKGAKTGTGYFRITNQGAQPDRLIALKSPVAQKVTLHGSVKQDKAVNMFNLDHGIEIKPGETVELKPGGMHVMFEGLRAPLLEASRVQGTLVFERAGSIDVDYAIEQIGTKAAAPSHHH